MNAQSGGFNYKAIINDGGNPLNNQAVNIRFTLLESGITTVYQETQNPTTDNNGIILVNIGEGTPIGQGDFNFIDWTSDLYLKVEINTGSGYQDFGTTAFQYVPYSKWADSSNHANWADEAGNVPENTSDLTNDSGFISSEIDGSTTNELQTISKTGNTVTLSNGGGSFTDADTDTHLTETQVDNFVANNGYLTQEVDASVTNELQTLAVSGTTLTISDGNSVTLPTGSGGDQWGTQIVESDTSLSGAGTSTNPLSINTSSSAFNNWDKNASDDFDGDFANLSNVPAGLADGDDDTQLTETQVDNFVSNNGYLTSFTEVDGSTTNELQTISKTGNTVTLSNGGGSFTDADTDTQLTETQVDNFVANNGYLTSFTEVDGSTTNELQTISKTGNTVTLSNGGGSFTDADTDTQLTETQVDNFVSNNGYLTSFTEVDGDTTNELQTLSITGDQLTLTDGNTVTLPSSSGADVDFLEVGTGSAPNNILDNIYHTGNISIGHTAAPNAKMDIKNTGTATALNANTGVTIQNNNSSATDKIGVKTTLENPSANTAKAYGVKNDILDSGDGDIYGEYTNIGGGNGDGEHYGAYYYMDGEGSSKHTGAKAYMFGNAQGEQIGFEADINALYTANTSDLIGVKTNVRGFATGDKYGMVNLLDGDADGNLFGTENTISNTSDYPHYGTINRMEGSGSGNHHATSNIITGTGSGKQYAIRNYDNNNGDNTHYGVYTDINGAGSGQHIGVNNKIKGDGTGEQIAVLNEVSNTSDATHYGVKNLMTSNGNGVHYGNYSELTGSGTGIQTGSFNKVSSTGSNIHTGVQTLLTGTSTGAQVGAKTNIDNSGDGYHYGTITILDGSGSGQHVGASNRLSGIGTGVQYGIKTNVNNSGDATHYGSYIELSNGSGTKYGTKTAINSTSSTSDDYGNYTVISGSGTGNRYGAKTIISNSNNDKHYGNYVQLNGNGAGKHYGFYSDVSGSGAESKLGVYSVIDPAANGNQFAIYGKALRNTGVTYAGYFEGDAKVTGKLKGDDSGDADMKAYIYGNINADATSPSIIASGSSDGFALTRIATGQYEINFDSFVSAGSNGYIVVVTLNNQGDAWVSNKLSSHFYINIKKGLTSKDYDFQFVVYKK